VKEGDTNLNEEVSVCFRYPPLRSGRYALAAANVCNRCICIHRLRIPHIRLIIFALDTGKAYSEKTDGCDDAPVLCACETLDGAAATLSVQLLGSHYIEAVLG
jgi:hypothetical protein